ncbi:MAG: DUF2723 domain-containing protein [bacterium]
MIGVFIFFGVFLVYLLTSYPTIPFHDAGDMVSAGYLLGIPHPTGYPLFTIFGKLFISIIPFGNIAFRMNVFSALFASLAVMMVYFITLKVSTRAPEYQNTRTIPAIVASLILAFSATFWEQAVIAEKYTLNAFFATLIIFVLLKWQDKIRNLKSEIRNLYLFSFLLGLSFTHHMQTSFLIPGALFFILAILWKNGKKPKTQRPGLLTQDSRLKTLLKMTILFILPLFLYLSLPIRSSAHPWVNWGDPDRLNGFIDYLTAKGYAHYFEKSSILDHFKRGFLHWKSHIPNQFLLLFLPSIIGFFLFFFKKRNIFIFFLLILLANTTHCTHYNIPNVWDYYIPTYIILSISLGFFLSFIASLHRILSIILIFFILLPLYPFSKNITSHNRSRDYSYYDEGMGYLKPLKKNAIFLTKGDICFVLWYLHYVENARSDIFLINGTFLHTFWLMDEINKHHPELIFDRTLPDKRVSSLELANVRFEKYKEIMEKNSKTHIIYTPFSDEITKGFRLIPEGFVQRVIGKEISQDEYIKMVKNANFNIFPYQGRSKGLMNNVKKGYISQGVLLSELSMNSDAIISFKNALNLDPKDSETKVSLSKCYYNLALGFDQRGLFNDAENYYKKAIKVDNNMIDAHFNLGLLYHKRQNPKMTIYYWSNLLKVDSKNIKTLENLATVYYNTGNFKSAKAICKRILTIQSNNNLANQMLLAIGGR